MGNLILYSSSWIPRPQLVAFASRRIYGLTTTSRFAYQSAHFPTTKPTATAFNHFITMAGKRLRCNAKECREPAQRIVGDCGFCNGHFCGKHRLLEDHKCSGLEDVRILCLRLITSIMTLTIRSARSNPTSETQPNSSPNAPKSFVACEEQPCITITHASTAVLQVACGPTQVDHSRLSTAPFNFGATSELIRFSLSAGHGHSSSSLHGIWSRNGAIGGVSRTLYHT